MSEEKASLKAKEKPQKEEESDSSGGEEFSMEGIRKFFAQKLHLNASHSDSDVSQQKAFENLTFDGLCKHWNEKGFKNIVTMVGAGISTSAGIPDFRSPGSGLYDNLQKYKLPYPTAIFELDYFNDNPQPFFALAKELYPGTFNPTPSHYFVRLLHEKGLLIRHYTQNIDTLDRIAGIPDNKLVEAHGTFYTNHCLGCRKAYSMEWMKKQIFSDHVPTCKVCNSVVKPDIVFFGESLPEKFYTLPEIDFKNCDLLIIMGTSLEVQPFASLIEHVGPNCVRLLINRTMVKSGHSFFGMFRGSQLLCGEANNTRDVAFIGDCDDGVLALAKALGWEKELLDLIDRDHKRLAQEAGTDNKSVTKESPKQLASNKTKNEKQNDDKPSVSAKVSHAATSKVNKSDDKKVAKDSN